MHGGQPESFSLAKLPPNQLNKTLSNAPIMNAIARFVLKTQTSMNQVLAKHLVSSVKNLKRIL